MNLKRDCGHCNGTGKVDILPPELDYIKKQIAIGGLMSGHLGTAKFAFQVAGMPICDDCTYIKKHCKCNGSIDEKG